DVRREREGVADGVLGVVPGVGEVVDGDDEGNRTVLEVVDRGEGFVDPPQVDQYHGAYAAARQFVPHEPEAVLSWRAEQVDDQGLVDGDTAEVHGDGGRALVGDGQDAVEPFGRRRHRLLRQERRDFRECP